MNTHIAKPQHEVVYQELSDLIRRHAGNVSKVEILAVAANMLGKLIALQDQRVMTFEKVTSLVAANIEVGNQEAIKELRDAAQAQVAH